jgi:hypothetical protein
VPCTDRVVTRAAAVDGQLHDVAHAGPLSGLHQVQVMCGVRGAAGGLRGHQECAIDAVECRVEAGGVVAVAVDGLHTRWHRHRIGTAGHGAYRLVVRDDLSDQRAADMPGGAGYEDHRARHPALCWNMAST